MPITGVSAVGGALLLIGLLVFGTSERAPARPRLALTLRVERSTALAGLAGRATELAERSLRRRGRRESLNASLERAGLALRPGEFVVIGAAAGFCAFVVGALMLGLAGGLLLALGALLICRAVLRIRINRRRMKFDAQLADTLQLMVGSLRAGYGLLAAIDGVAKDGEAPTTEEFGRLLMETRLGRDVADALRSMAARVGSEDFDWVVQAIEINRDVGGNLTELLDSVSHTIRERSRIRRQISTLSAEGRMSATVLTLLPILMFGYMGLTNPDDFTVLTSTTSGNVMLGIGIVLLTLGALWLRKLVRVVF
jgi:tight adherence protein B